MSFSLEFINDEYEEQVVASIDAVFRGRCTHYALADEFADLLASLGKRWLSSDDAIKGVWLNGCVRLLIEPTDSLGHMRARVHIRDKDSDWTMAGADYSITYSDLDRFRDELALALDAGHGTATLRAST